MSRNIYTLATPFDKEDAVHAGLNGKIFSVYQDENKRLRFMDACEEGYELLESTPVVSDTSNGPGTVRVLKTWNTEYRLINVLDVIPTCTTDKTLIKEKADTASVYGGDPNTIFNVRVVPSKGFGQMAKVIADVNDGRTDVVIFEFFDDELHFTPAELNGLTIDQANELKHKKDIAYLQS